MCVWGCMYCLVEVLGLLNLCNLYLPSLFLFLLPLLFLCFPSGYLLLTSTLLYNIWPKNIRLNHKSLHVWATWEHGYIPTYTLICNGHTRSVFTLLNTYFILSLLLLPPSLFFFLSLPLLLFLLPLAVLLSLAVHLLHLVGI